MIYESINYLIYISVNTEDSACVGCEQQWQCYEQCLQPQQRGSPRFSKTLIIVELWSMMKRLGKQVLFCSLNKMRKTILQIIIFFGSNSKTGII